MTAQRPTVAVVGAGISGLAAAYSLRNDARVTLFEAGSHFGGHAQTVDLSLPSTMVSDDWIEHGVDTGFLVYNDRTYPNLIRLFSELGVETAESDMSFSVQVPRGNGTALEWSGNNLDTVFAQRRNLLDHRFLGMLGDLLRFNKLTTRIAQAAPKASSSSRWARSLTNIVSARRFASGISCR